MRNAATVLMLITILTALTSSAEPLHTKLNVGPRAGFYGKRVEHGYSYGAGMNSASALCQWYTLNSMAARLIVQAREVITLQLNLQRPKNGFLSGEAVSQSDVGIDEIMGKQARIFATLCRPNFDDAFHFSVLPLQVERC